MSSDMPTLQPEQAERQQDSVVAITKQVERLITVPSALSYKDWLKVQSSQSQTPVGDQKSTFVLQLKGMAGSQAQIANSMPANHQESVTTAKQVESGVYSSSAKTKATSQAKHYMSSIMPHSPSLDVLSPQYVMAGDSSSNTPSFYKHEPASRVNFTEQDNSSITRFDALEH